MLHHRYDMSLTTAHESRTKMEKKMKKKKMGASCKDTNQPVHALGVATVIFSLDSSEAVEFWCD